MGDYRRTKSKWMRPSLNPMGPNARNNEPGQAAKVRSPWDQDSRELMDDFYSNLDAVNTEVSHPWDITESDIINMEKQRTLASTYKYESLFEVPEMTASRKQQLADYKYNPPFNCGFNEVEETKRSPRRQIPNKNPKTKDPWAWGSEPGEPVHRKIHPKPSTGLWDVPRGDQSENPKAAMVASGDPVLDNLRSQLFAHGAAGIQGLARKFRIMDDDGSGTLDMNEFRKGMKECGLVELSDRAISHLFRYFDKDDTGTITYDEFLVGIRGVMNERRKKMVELAYRVLDSDHSGVVDIEDVKLSYDVSSHPDVLSGRLTRDEALLDFLDTFRIASKRGKHNRPPSGGITLEDFCEYYANLSASVDSDDYFELMIRNAWHISGGSGWCENTTNRRLLVTHADGRQSVQEIQNDIGVRAKDTDKMMLKLQAQGVTDVKNINLTGIEDMKHQVENPQYRAALQKQLDEENRQEWLREQQQQQNPSAKPIPTANNADQLYLSTPRTTAAANQSHSNNNPNGMKPTSAQQQQPSQQQFLPPMMRNNASMSNTSSRSNLMSSAPNSARNNNNIYNNNVNNNVYNNMNPNSGGSSSGMTGLASFAAMNVGRSQTTPRMGQLPMQPSSSSHPFVGNRTTAGGIPPPVPLAKLV